jgi:hypothetical protein
MRRLLVSQRIGLYITFATSFILGILIADFADAADNGYRFVTSNVQVSENTRSYGSYIRSAVSDYNDNTDLTVRVVSNASGVVAFTQGNYGQVGWLALTMPVYSSSRTCIDFNSGDVTGLCNKTTYKARSAVIYFNDRNGIFPPSSRNFATRHEFGHVFGLAHPSCSIDSVMVKYACSQNPSRLRSYERNLVNKWY